MTVEILDEALDDLADGFEFYEQQEAGIGAFFLDSLYSDIDSLRIYAGIHRSVFGYHRCLSKRFPFAILRRRGHPGARPCMESLTAAGTPNGFRNG